MADEIMTTVAEETADVIEEAVANNATGEFTLNNLEFGLMLGGAFALGVGCTKLWQFIRKKRAEKGTEKKPGKLGKLFKKSKKAVEEAAEDIGDAVEEFTEA